MSSQFEFLKEYDKSAYKWARNMERTLYTEPLGSLAYGGRFIESIRTALYQNHYKEMEKYNRNLSKTDSANKKINSLSFKQEDLAKHISDLYHAKLIKSTDSYKIIHAYNIRHKLHENEDIDDIESDRNAALELYKEVFEIAIWFAHHIDPTFDVEIEFAYPSGEIAEKQIPDVNIVKIFNDCVICGRENISSNRNICPECYRKIRLASDLEDLIDLLNNENRFTKEFLNEHSYDRYEIDYMIHFLREFDLRSSESKGEYILKDSNTLYDFIDETKSYEEVEKILIAFYNELIDEKDIDCGENSFYKLGELGGLYHQFYILIITKKIKHYLNLKSKNIPNACEKSGVTITEISNWYERKVKKIIKSNYKRYKDISFNQMSRILMNKWIEYRENKEKKESIKAKLKLSDTVLDFWLDDSLRTNNKYPYIKEFIFKNKEIEMKLFVEGLSLGLNKKDAIEFADTSYELVDKYFNLSDEDVLIRHWRIGKQNNNEEHFKRYKNIYFHNKIKEFLNYLNGDTIDNALLKSDLDEEDFNKWYKGGQKEFFKHNCDLENDLFKCYIKTTKILMANWLNERKEGHKKLESCKNIGLYSDTLKEWFKFESQGTKNLFTNPKYKVFRNFYINNDKTNMDLIIKAIEDGQNKQRLSKTTDINLNEINALYNWGRFLSILEGENDKEIVPSKEYNFKDNLPDEVKEYIEIGIKNLNKEDKQSYIQFYKNYEELYNSKRIDEFLSLCERKGDVPKVMKNFELGEERIKFMYEQGKLGDEEYREFYERFLEVKLTVYTSKTSSKVNKTRALKESGLSEEELEENAYRINVLELIFPMIRVINLQAKGKKLDKIVNKSPFSINDVFNWYLKGKELMEEEDEEYLELEDFFETNRINFFDVFNEIEAEDGDFDPYYMKFYNIYNEIHVKPATHSLSINYTEDKKFLRKILRDMKITQKEYDFWMKLGLIKNERDIDLTEEEKEKRSKYKIKRI